MVCPKIGIEEKLFSLIKENVIDLPSDKIREIYSFYADEELDAKPKNMRDIYVQDAGKISVKQNVPEGASLLGIDFPTWFNTPLNKPKIMIIGIDPKRDEHVFNLFKANSEKDVIMGTPYALHVREFRDKKQNMKWQLIESLSQENFVYLTDIYKTYFWTVYQAKNIESKSFYRRVCSVDSHKELIEKEIELIDPDLIVTFGEIPFTVLMDIGIKVNDKVKKYLFRNKYPVLPMVHYTGGQQHRSQFLKKNGIVNKNLPDGYYELINSYIKSLKGIK